MFLDTLSISIIAIKRLLCFNQKKSLLSCSLNFTPSLWIMLNNDCVMDVTTADLV